MLFCLAETHPYYVAVQYHPEFLSRPLRPSPPYFGLILASCGKLRRYFERGSLSPRFFYGSETSQYKDESSDEELKETLRWDVPETGGMALAEKVESDQAQ